MAEPRERLRVEELSASYGNSPVLTGISLAVGTGEILALLGPNGSGKTTLLRCIAGLERPRTGRVWLDGEEVGRLPAHRRRIGLLSQEAALFPNRTVLENVAYGPLVQGRTPAEAREEARQALKVVRLEGFEARAPGALSGGERQRVALARAIAARPRVILLDEPFAAIDPVVRAELLGEFRRILTRLGIASVHVTHDRDEGMFLGDRVAILLEGRIRASGPPSGVYNAPGSVAVARFLGYNVLRSGDGWLALRPSEVLLGPVGSGELDAEMLASGPTSRGSMAIARTEHGERVEFEGARDATWPAPGERVGVRWSASRPVRGDPPA